MSKISWRSGVGEKGTMLLMQQQHTGTPSKFPVQLYKITFCRMQIKKYQKQGDSLPLQMQLLQWQLQGALSRKTRSLTEIGEGKKKCQLKNDLLNLENKAMLRLIRSRY